MSRVNSIFNHVLQYTSLIKLYTFHFIQNAEAGQCSNCKTTSVGKNSLIYIGSLTLGLI
jgi:hypothetical protein